MDGKVCTKCKQWKAWDQFYHKAQSKDGYDSWCNKCNRADVAARRARDPEAAREKARQYARRYDQAHCEERRSYAREYYRAHREQMRAYARKYNRKRAETLAVCTKPPRHRLSPEERKARRREYVARYSRARRQRDQAVRALESARRRAKRAGLPYKLTVAEARRILETGCLLCGTFERLQMCHNVPIARQGPTVFDNLICLCHHCNQKMQTKTLAEMMEVENIWLL